MQENDERTVLTALDERLAQTIKRLTAMEYTNLIKTTSLTLKNSSCNESTRCSDGEILSSIVDPIVFSSNDDKARSIENPPSTESIDSRATPTSLKEKCLNVSSDTKETTSSSADSLLNSSTPVSECHFYGESTPSAYSVGSSWQAPSISPITQHRKTPLPPTTPIVTPAGQNSTSTTTIHKLQELINQAYDSSDPELHTLADEVRELRFSLISKKQLVHSERCQFQKECKAFREAKLKYNKECRDRRTERETEDRVVLKERQSLERLRKELDEEKQQISQLAQVLEERDISMMKIADRGGECVDNSEWKACLRRYKEAVKEKDKYIALNLDLAAKKRKLDNAQQHMEEEKGAVDQQKELLKTAQKRLEEKQRNLFPERRKIEIQSNELRHVKESISKEVIQLEAQKQSYNTELKNLEIQKEKLQSQRESFSQEQEDFRKKELAAQNELKKLEEKETIIVEEEAKIRLLLPEIIKERELCTQREEDNLYKSEELEILINSMNTLLDAKQDERRAITVIKKFEEEQRTSQLLQKQASDIFQHQHR